MRAIHIIATLMLLPTCLWGQHKGLALGDDKQRASSYAYLEERIRLLEQDELLSPSAVLALREEWEKYVCAPLDVRRASLQEFLALPLMTEYKAQQLISYRQDPTKSLDELSDLKAIEGWDEDFVAYLTPMLRLEDTHTESPSLERLLSDGQTRASVLFTRPWVGEDQEQKYIGSPERLDLRYLWQSGRHLSLSLGASKDNYEPWRYARHRGFDSYHGHIALRDIGILKKFVVGQYRASWAEGLILAQGFRSRSLLYNVSEEFGQLKAHRGLSEYRLSQGFALELGLTRHLSVVALASCQGIDASLSEEGDSFGAVVEGGRHRSEYDYRKRHSLVARHMGLRLVYQLGRLNLSLQSLHYDWSGRKLNRALGASYHLGLRDMRGMSNYSLAYHYSSPKARVRASGECALSERKGVALVNRFVVYNEALGSLRLLSRYVDGDYWAYLGQAPTYYDRPHNEWGVGFAYSPHLWMANLRLSLEGDYCRSVVARGERGHTRAYFLRLVAEGRLSEQLSWQGRSSLRSNAEGQCRWGLSLLGRCQREDLSMELRLESLFARQRGGWHRGCALVFRSSYTLGNSWQIFASLVGHKVEDWSARIYYSPSRLSDEYLRHTLVGKGVLLGCGLRARLSRRLSLGLRLRHHQLSTPRPNYTEVALQLTYRGS